MSGDTNANACTLLVAAPGEPLGELHALRERFVGLGPVEWVTCDTTQARELLPGETVHLVPALHPRDLRGAMSALAPAQRLITERRAGRVVATGPGTALSHVLAARRLGVPAHYVEGASRATGPGLTGAVVARIPGVHLYTQHLWREPGWSLRGSVFDGYVAAPFVSATRLDRVVVSLGAGRSFRAAAEALVRALGQLGETGGHSPEVLWQVGGTDVSDLGIDAHDTIALQELRRAVTGADLVISHAGVDAAMLALEAGKVPVLVPRRRHRGEHVDDHQADLARLLHGRGLAQHVEVDAISPETLTAGLNRTVLHTDAMTAPFHLAPEGERSGRSVRRSRDAGATGQVVPLRPVPTLAVGAPGAGLPPLVVARATRSAPWPDPLERPGRVTVRVPQQRRARLSVVPGGRRAQDAEGDPVRS